MSKSDRVVKIFLTILGFVVFVVCGTFNFMANVPSAVADENVTYNAAPGLFSSDTEDRGAKYPNPITPAAWAFIIVWPLIFLWNFVGILYFLVSLCLDTDKSPILRGPPLVPKSSLILWSITWGSLVGWVFVQDREFYALAMTFIIIAAISGYACLGFSYRSYFQDILLLEEEQRTMLLLVRILFHNGFAILITWLTCAWKLELVKVIAYVDSRGIDTIPAQLRGSLTPEDAGTIALSILLVEIITWFILENFVFERYCRYTLTIYPVLIYAFSAIFANEFIVLTGPIIFPRVKVITLTGLVLASVMFIVRIFLVIKRHRKRLRFT